MLMHKYFLLQAEPDAAGGGVPEPVEPESFSKEYVRELRAENKGWRLKAQEAAQAVEKAAADAVALTQAAEAKAAERILRAELKAAALQAGMVDLDGLKLADLSQVKLLEDGAIEGVGALMEALRSAKPWLFGVVSHSAAPQPAPRPKEAEAQDARRMTDVEYKAARERLAGR